jgi:hypothetical protein
MPTNRMNALCSILLAGTLGGCMVGNDDGELVTSYATSNPSGEVVARWNKNAIQDLLPTPPTDITRSLAMVHIAMHDAANAVRPHYAAYAYADATDVGAEPALAAAVAAATVLKHRRPGLVAQIDAQLAQDLAAVSPKSRRDASVAVGQAAANAIIALRSNDGSTVQPGLVPYTNGSQPGEYRATHPQGLVLAPQWGNVTPFALAAGNQFVGDGPPAIGSAEYTADFEEVKALGSAGSTARSAEQTAEAKFWIENPPTVFNRVAQKAIADQGLDLWQAAQGMALTQISFADAIIASWNAKYTVKFWRPITAIRLADTDGNDATTSDTAWTSLNVTPPFPEYDSAHAVVAGASAAVLTQVFGSVGFTETSGASGSPITRTYTSWQHAADLSTDSRIWGGFHFRDACEDGQATGEAIGQHILNSGLLAHLPPQ